jgi:hypothetical protein
MKNHSKVMMFFLLLAHKACSMTGGALIVRKDYI